MAILKDLIVHGPSRFLNGAKFNTINAESIGAEQGIFNKLIATTLDAKEATIDNLTAQNATVVGLLDVQGELHTNAWTNANIANIGGSFYISPTVEPTDGTTTISITRNSATSWTVSASGTFATDFIKSGTATSGVAWPANSLVLITGDIVLGDMIYPLGTLKGTLSSQVTATAASTSKTITITGVTDAQNNNSPSVLQELYELNNNANISGATYKNGKISLYKLGSNPIGILLSSMGTSSNSIIDIYGGVSTNPSVRIGHLAGLPNVNESAPTGWGIYTDNGYFSGVIVSTSGKIGGWTLGTSAIYNNTNSKTSTAVGTYLGTDAIRNYSSSTQYVHIEGGKITAKNVDLSGTITATAGTIGGASISNGVLQIANANITSLSADKINSGDIEAARIQTNLITAINAKVSDLSALTATIGGFAIDSTSIHTSGVEVTSNTDNSIALSSADFTRTINDISREGLRLAIGDKFGVTGDGSIYASNADITGSINATSFIASYNGGNPKASLDSTGLVLYDNNGYMRAQFGNTIYLWGGSSASATTSTYPYVSLSSTASTGLTIANSSTYKTTINTSGMKIYAGDSSNAVANFGSTVTIGKTNSTNGNIVVDSTNGLMVRQGTTTLLQTYYINSSVGSEYEYINYNSCEEGENVIGTFTHTIKRSYSGNLTVRIYGSAYDESNSVSFSQILTTSAANITKVINGTSRTVGTAKYSLSNGVVTVTLTGSSTSYTYTIHSIKISYTPTKKAQPYLRIGDNVNSSYIDSEDNQTYYYPFAIGDYFSNSTKNIFSINNDGDITTDGAIYCLAHNSAIGNIVIGTVRVSLALASGTPKYLARIDLTDGVWILIGSVTFPSNVNGCRRIVINTTPDSGGLGIQVPAYSRDSSGAQGYKIRIQATNFANVNVGSDSEGNPNVLKYYLTAFQNSGSTLTAEAIKLWAIRIC